MNDFLAIDAAEAELQQELREMFAVDTQQHLETYFSTIQQLNPQSWAADIQHLYRAIHTVKGGAVTVSADAMLHAGMVLEDLLSDLRYLETAPDLTDGKLVQILLEAGELLTSSMEIVETGDLAQVRVQPTVNRLTQLRDRVKQLYLPEWNELTQVHQEFAEQGFDLVVLELEMALGNMPSQGLVPAATIDTAQRTIEQLTQIGIEIELAEDWRILLQDTQELITKPDCQLWAAVWFEYFELLKICVKNSGNLTPTEIEKLDELTSVVKAVNLDAIDLNITTDLDLTDSLDSFFLTAAGDELELESSTESSLADSLDSFFSIEEGDELELESSTDLDLADSLDGFFSIEEGDELEPEIEPSLADSLDSFFLAVASDELAPSSDENSLADSLNSFFLTADNDLSDANSIETLTNDGAEARSELLTSLSGLTEFNEEIADDIDSYAIDTLSDPIERYLEATDNQASERAALTLDDSISDLADVFDALDEFFDGESSQNAARLVDREIEPATTIASESVAEIPAIPTATTIPIVTAEIATTNPVNAVKRSIQIPVPLERLDKSARQVVETLLTARAVTSISDRLQSQLTQLNALTKENSQFVTRLRQLQDDYALMRNLSDERQDSETNVTLERYRQGYTTIVRLLENILRLSELGQEIESSTYQSAIRLDALDRSILQLKDGIETSRLVPFRNLTLRAKAILRDLTNRYGKPAQLVVDNEQVELDAGIVQQLEPALLHLLRNAYDHGLESTEQRLKAGKSVQGKIEISLQQQGNLYLLTIEDDGGGIDAKKISEIARAKGFALYQTRTNAEILAVLCQPGFSSSGMVTEVSGRGVGMDVVMSQIDSIGGKLSLTTAAGYGTKFTIEVPAPQLLLPCVLFKVGDRTIAFPTDNVLETSLLGAMTIAATDINVGLCTWNLTNLRGEMPGFDLDLYWQPANLASGKLSRQAFPESAVCIRMRQAPDTPTIWSIADDPIGQAKLLITPLPSPLIPPVGLLGVSLQPDGSLISILDPISLTTMVTSTARPTATASDNRLETVPTTNVPRSTAPTILIVDDAALMRRRFEASLQTYGFITHTCNDGLEALKWLQANPYPDLMITDVEMPNMDGFTLIDRIRQTNSEMPILVVSSRSSAEWSKEARRLGANDYLNKGFSTPEMLQKVNSLLGLVTKV